MLASNQRVHILGLGSIGTFAAHCLASITNRPPITLLLHRRSLLGDFISNNRSITLKVNSSQIEKQANFDVEYLDNENWYNGSSSSVQRDTAAVMSAHISHLLVCTKTIQTVEALRPLAHRLSTQSTIVILQNGSGVVDDLNATIFPNPLKRPSYVLGVTSHGVGFDRPFNVTHTGPSAAFFGPASQKSNQDKRIDDYLTNLLCASPRLNAVQLSPIGILAAQLSKLAVNAFCNPVCGLNSAPNRLLFSLPSTRKAILTEISAVIQSLPELHGHADVKESFSVERLEEMVEGVIQRTAETTCSMVWDLRAGRRTEVGFINGYWCRRGREVGLPTPVNDVLMEMVRAREETASRGGPI